MPAVTVDREFFPDPISATLNDILEFLRGQRFAQLDDAWVEDLSWNGDLVGLLPTEWIAGTMDTTTLLEEIEHRLMEQQDAAVAQSLDETETLHGGDDNDAATHADDEALCRKLQEATDAKDATALDEKNAMEAACEADDADETASLPPTYADSCSQMGDHKDMLKQDKKAHATQEQIDRIWSTIEAMQNTQRHICDIIQLEAEAAHSDLVPSKSDA
ncbi:hypothetical protein CXG81DRAFT_24947 [Caulochytrium protostelioides]|uniref:Uncharacterized protein n=1 Tax=Caulochytrium protostelioides TaxID=1555241 RepID=A0A4P9XAJ9_9FUNG|nr:hypothetical protein CXG81DRAFT_24947 [Caulochytrium protostelioides]|eukprot:RKP02403.1 hypothetical protein CXG81DRAFT_24947 [Caulochytrium protostelioides]